MKPRSALLLAGTGLLLGGSLIAGAVVLHQPPASAGAEPGFSPAPTPAEPAALDDLAKQYPALAPVLQDPKLASVIKEFALAYQKDGAEGARSFAKERGFLNSNQDITLTVLTETPDTSELEGIVRDLKGRVAGRTGKSLDVVLPWSAVQAAIAAGSPPGDLLVRITQTKGVRGIVPTERPYANQKRVGKVSAATSSGSEGVGLTRAALWHRAGFRGKGVNVGILDPEVSRARTFLGTALPADTQILSGECVNGNGAGVDGEGLHGVAAAEIVHEMAPDARIFLACSLGDEEEAINWLVKNNVKIISFSAGAMAGPRNGEGPLQDRINRLAKAGVLWVNAAGNEGETFHRGKLTGGTESYFHQFAPRKTTMAFRPQAGEDLRITLIWNQWDDIAISDYDLFVFDSKNREVARSANNNFVLRQPQEKIRLHLPADSDYFVSVRGNGHTQATSFLLSVDGARRIEFLNPAGSIDAPGDARGSLTVGAVVWKTDRVAAYSSRGFTEDGRLKPDMSAPTEIASLVYGGSFAGTSSRRAARYRRSRGALGTDFPISPGTKSWRFSRNTPKTWARTEPIRTTAPAASTLATRPPPPSLPSSPPPRLAESHRPGRPEAPAIRSTPPPGWCSA